MAKLVFGMIQSLDGYVWGTADGPQLADARPLLHRHFNDHVRGLAGRLYGRRIYEMMQYWDEDRPEVGCDCARLCAGVAGAAEMGRVTHAEVGRSECDADIR